MILNTVQIDADDLQQRLHDELSEPDKRLGMLTSIDGSQLCTVVLNLSNKSINLWFTDVPDGQFSSLTARFPQCHMFERNLHDMFGLAPTNHPELKPSLLHDCYGQFVPPLNDTAEPRTFDYSFQNVSGEGVFEIPVGPIHAGIIEPGHFRFSCSGEIITNLEIRLGYLHRGVEKRLRSLPWKQMRFLVEAVASDSAVAYALCHAEAIESMMNVTVLPYSAALRTIALETERVAMHISDIGGIAGDIGFLAVSATMSRLRGEALRIGELLTGSRLQRHFIRPGGVSTAPSPNRLAEIVRVAQSLLKQFNEAHPMLIESPVARDRMMEIGTVTNAMAKDFGLVGVAARASGIAYDARLHFKHGQYPDVPVNVATQQSGDVMARLKCRIAEVQDSIRIISDCVAAMPAGDPMIELPNNLPANTIGVGIVESHRGELLHLIATGASGETTRYAIKDPSVNNWVALAIAAKQNLVADFPLCNKSLSLSYGGNDL